MKLILVCVLSIVTILDARHLTTNEKAYILNAHNYYRANPPASQPGPASDMKVLVWNDALAEKSRVQAETCSREHDAMINRTAGLGPGYDYVGQNYAGDYSIEAGFEGWLAEADYYDFMNTNCTYTSSKYTCGHYTQIMWANTSEIGCAVADCVSTIEGGYPFQLWCHYYDMGNYVNTAPYEVGGASCSQCPSDSPFCVSGLCAKTADEEVSFDLTVLEEEIEIVVAPGEENSTCPPPSRKSHSCVFPFIYGKNEDGSDTYYNDCDSSGWCAHTKYFNGLWSYCSKHYYKCQLPFTFNGKTYDHCVRGKFGVHWCSEDSVYNGYWHYCD